MYKNDSFVSQVWLLRGLFHSLPGVLKLEKNRLQFTAISTGTFGESGLQNIEKKSGAKKFTSLLKQHKPAQLFSVDLTEIQKITFPLIYFSAGVHITFNNEKYRLSFIEPNNTKTGAMANSEYDELIGGSIEIIQDIAHSRRVGKKWKSLLIK